MTRCDTLQMREAELNQSKSWTEAEYLALGETENRIELIDGGLRVSPHAHYFHQRISQFLLKNLEAAADTVDLLTTGPHDVRLGPDRIVIPDLIIAERPVVGPVADAADVVLVMEITSPGNASYDRVDKKRYYAEADIAWYLLVEPDMSDYKSVALHLCRLAGDRYIDHATAKNGETLVSNDPFPVEINTEELVRYVQRPGRGPR